MNTEKSMGHFTNWSFGVPVNVYYKNRDKSLNNVARLVYETIVHFVTVNDGGYFTSYNKVNYYYELISYTTYKALTRYPVCRSLIEVTYCNAGRMGQFYDCKLHEITLSPEPTATLIIDGKEIKLSAETTARLKKDLGV